MNEVAITSPFNLVLCLLQKLVIRHIQILQIKDADMIVIHTRNEVNCFKLLDCAIAEKSTYPTKINRAGQSNEFRNQSNMHLGAFD